jgi:hypothetical protein
MHRAIATWLNDARQLLDNESKVDEKFVVVFAVP